MILDETLYLLLGGYMKALLSLFILLTVSKLSLAAYRPISDDKMHELLKSFEYTPNVQSIRTATSSCEGKDFEFTTTYPQRETALNIKGKAFIPTNPNSPVPIVFMLPPISGANATDIQLGKIFCRNKIAAFIITSNLTGLGEDLVPVTDHDHTHRRVSSAIKGGIVIARTYPQINTDKVGLFGPSLGGILGSVVFSVLPEISAATFLVNGGYVPHILANSDQRPVVKLKNERMKEQKLSTNEEYEEYLNNKLEIDPLHFAKLVNPDSIKLYLSNADRSVPSVDQMAYYEALGKPKETKFYSVGHIPTIVAIMALSEEKQNIADWFGKRFALPNPRMSHDVKSALEIRF